MSMKSSIIYRGEHYTFSYMTNTYEKLKRSIKQNGICFRLHIL